VAGWWRGRPGGNELPLTLGRTESSLRSGGFMGDAKPATTQGIYAHRFNTYDHADAIAAVGHPAVHRDNVIPLHG
jgi:hypothetical protein